jgi:hypothetical protein
MLAAVSPETTWPPALAHIGICFAIWTVGKWIGGSTPSIVVGLLLTSSALGDIGGLFFTFSIPALVAAVCVSWLAWNTWATLPDPD